MQVRNLPEVEIAIRWPHHLIKRRQTFNDVLLNGILDTTAEYLPPSGHACGVVPDVVVLHNVAEELGFALR